MLPIPTLFFNLNFIRLDKWTPILDYITCALIIEHGYDRWELIT
jgi:hypothetical protein